MRPPSIRGFGIRYAIALTLPVTGIVLVLYTVVQLLSYSLQERLGPPRSPVRAIAGSLGQPGSGPVGPELAQPKPAQPKPAQPEPAQPELAQPEPEPATSTR